MTNRPKQRGTAAETAALRWLRANGFPWTERLTLTGSCDRGDLSLLPGLAVIAEIKNHAGAATGQPGQAQLDAWMAETETERLHASADHAALIVKRKGTTDVGRWWCYLPLGHLHHLALRLDAPPVESMSPTSFRSPACITPAMWVDLLRRADYGAEPEVAA